MNRVILVGRLTRDPELQYTANDIPVVQFTVAVNRPYQSRTGERQADFINCVAWRNQAENLARYMGKGSLIGVRNDPNPQLATIREVRKFITGCLRQHSILEPKSARQEYGSYPNVNQYDIPSQREKPREEHKDPFEDIESHFDVSNDDLPF